MPRINRVRVTNIKYDDDKKQMPDIIIDANGLNTVLLLANGGGKTLLIQLLIQAVLPNESMSGRKISDLLLSSKYTGHVVVEWLMDNTGDKRHYLCTGFCFTGGASDGQRLRYFNYLFDYQDFSGLNIETLPLLKEDQRGIRIPAGFMQLKDFFKDDVNHRVQVYERNYKYQERLKQYQILPEEWKNIRDTNGSEGGVDKFFEKSKTTQQLLDNLLIPGIEDMVFRSERKKNELVNAFREHRNMLIEVPVIKKNIEDFNVIKGHAEGLVEEVRQLDIIQREQDYKIKEMIALAKTFDGFQIAAAKKAEELAAESEKCGQLHRKLRWQKESYSVFQKQLEFNEAEAKEAEISLFCKREADHLKQFLAEEARIKGLFYYNKMEAARREAGGYEAELAKMDKDEPELLEELRGKTTELSGLWGLKEKLLQNQSRIVNKEYKALLDENATLESKIARHRKQEKNKQGKLAQVQAWLEQYRSNQEKLLRFVSRKEVLAPDKALTNHRHRLAGLGGEEEKIKADIRATEQQQRDLGDSISQLNTEIVKAESQADSLNEKLKEFLQREEGLCSLLAENELYLKSLLSEKEKVWFWSQDRLRQAQEGLVVRQARLANLREKWVLLGDKDYYIPHSELLKIKQHLESKDIYVLLGSEWLAGQKFDEGEKKAYLRNQPLLPYAIIIESTQINGVKYALKQIKDWTRDLPLLFLVKSQESLRGDVAKKATGANVVADDSGRTGQLVELDDELLLYRPDSHSVFSSTDSLQQYKNEMEQQIATVENNVQNLTDEVNKYIHIREQVKSFYQNYNDELIIGWRSAKKDLERQINDFKAGISDAKKQVSYLKGELKKKENKLEKLQEEKVKEKSLIEKLQEFLAVHNELSEKQGREGRYKSVLADLGKKISAMELQQRENYDAIGELKLKLNDSQKLLSAHEQDFHKYRLVKMMEEAPDKTDSTTVMAHYVNSKTDVAAIQKRLEQRQSSRGSVEKLLQKAQEAVENNRLAIIDTGTEEKWLAANQRWVSNHEVAEAKSVSRQQAVKYEQAQKELFEAEKITIGIKGVLDDRVKRTQDEFQMEPYYDYTELNHSLEYKKVVEDFNRLLETIKKLKLDIDSNQEWLKENRNAYLAVKERLETSYAEWWREAESLTDEAWDEYRAKPQVVIRRCDRELANVKSRLQEQKDAVLRKFQSYLTRLESTENAKIKQFIRNVSEIMDGGRIYDYDFVETQFLRIFEGLDVQIAQFQNMLQEKEKDQRILIDLCLRRARTIYDSIMEIQKNSRVKLYQRDVQVIRMGWPIANEKEAWGRIYNHLYQVLEDLQQWQQGGLDEDEMNRRVEELLKTRNLIQVIAPIEDCRVTVFKPRKESIMRYHKLEYSRWDEVYLWSGAEKYSIYITMFMIMVSHIRQQMLGSTKTWKVILADNPFGKASSPHVLETVFQVAKSNRIQLICLTAHKEDSILLHFPVVYSLQLRNAYGKEIMKAEQIETGFYRYDTLADGVQMALPLDP